MRRTDTPATPPPGSTGRSMASSTMIRSECGSRFDASMPAGRWRGRTPGTPPGRRPARRPRYGAARDRRPAFRRTPTPGRRSGGPERLEGGIQKTPATGAAGRRSRWPDGARLKCASSWSYPSSDTNTYGLQPSCRASIDDALAPTTAPVVQIDFAGGDWLRDEHNRRLAGQPPAFCLSVHRPGPTAAILRVLRGEGDPPPRLLRRGQERLGTRQQVQFAAEIDDEQSIHGVVREVTE